MIYFPIFLYIYFDSELLNLRRRKGYTAANPYLGRKVGGQYS